MVIHSIPSDILPPLKEDLQQVMAATLLNSCEITVLDSRFLQPDPEIRTQGSATSVVVTINPDDVPKLGTRVRIFSKSCPVRPAHSSSRYSQCRKCLRYGHFQVACKALHPTCPLCALHHTQSEHRCANPGCPKQGNLRPVPACCLASPLQCACCGNQHAAYDRACPARPRQPLHDDQMDISVPLPADTTTPPPPIQGLEQTPRQPSPMLDKGKQVQGMPPPVAYSHQRSTAAMPVLPAMGPQPLAPAPPCLENPSLVLAPTKHSQMPSSTLFPYAHPTPPPAGP